MGAARCHQGPLYALQMSPDTPFTVAFCGGKGQPKVWDLLESTPVRSRFRDRCRAPVSGPAHGLVEAVRSGPVTGRRRRADPDCAHPHAEHGPR